MSLTLEYMMGHALVDTAAGQERTCKEDLDNLVDVSQQRDFHVHVELGRVKGQTATGIGGRTEPLGRACA